MSLLPTGNNPEHLKLAFWCACMEAQAWEMKEAMANNDFSQFRKESADCVLVGLDAIRHLGLGDAMQAVFLRMAENIPKFTNEGLSKTPRNTQYYLDKIANIRAKLENPCCFGENGGHTADCVNYK